MSLYWSRVVFLLFIVLIDISSPQDLFMYIQWLCKQLYIGSNNQQNRFFPKLLLVSLVTRCWCKTHVRNLLHLQTMKYASQQGNKTWRRTVEEKKFFLAWGFKKPLEKRMQARNHFLDFSSPSIYHTTKPLDRVIWFVDFLKPKPKQKIYNQFKLK